MLFLTSIILVLSVSLTFCGSKCDAKLAQLIAVLAIQDEELLKQEFLPYFTYTGKSIGSFGDYDACQREFKYYFLQITLPGTNQVFTHGICFTNECTATELNENVPMLKSVISEQYAEVKMPFNISAVGIQFSEAEDFYPSFGFGTCITIFILLILLACSLIIPIHKLKEGIDHQEIRKEHSSLENKGQIDQIETEKINNTSDQNQHQNSLENASRYDLHFYKHFSLIDNSRQLFKLTTPDQNLTIFNGFRALSFILVLLGHEFFFLILGDLQSAPIVFPKPFTMLLFDCFFAVDAFFWIGGFFVAYVMADENKLALMRKQGLTSIPLAFIHRLLRIWPCYLILILIQSNIVTHLGDGPKVEYLADLPGDCSTKWWQNMLFVGIYQGSSCIGWGWYLDNDVQLFLVSATIMYIYSRPRKSIAKKLVVFCLIATQIIGTITTFTLQLRIPYFTQVRIDSTFFEDYYTKPWCRAPPYFLGLLVGIYYREHKTHTSSNIDLNNQDLPIPLLTKLQQFASRSSLNYYKFIGLMYGIGGFLILWLSFGWRNAQTQGEDFWPLWQQELYWAFSRTLYVLGMTFISVPNLLGFNDWFNTALMNNWFFQLVAKISFTAYLVHFSVLLLIIFKFYEDLQATIFNGVYLACGSFFVVMVVSILMTLLVEMPFANIVNTLFKQKSKALVTNANESNRINELDVKL